MNPLLPYGVAIAAFLFARTVFAGKGTRSDGGGKDDGSNAGEGGNGPGGTPKPDRGGVTKGKPRDGVTYQVPEGWDPIRGLWISPDCEFVVEGPAWWTGLIYVDDQGTAELPRLKYGPEGFPSGYLQQGFMQIPAPENRGGPILQFMDRNRPDIGAVMWSIGEVGHSVGGGRGRQPEEVAQEILAAYAPMCADTDPELWSDALQDWYQSIVRRLSDLRESTITEDDGE